MKYTFMEIVCLGYMLASLRQKYIKSLLESKLAIRNFHVCIYVNEEVKQNLKYHHQKKKPNWKDIKEKPNLYLCFPNFIDLSDNNLRKHERKLILKQNILSKAFIKLL